MKFTKEQAVEKLNQELTNSGKKPLRMSARTLETQAENLMGLVGDEEMELDAFVEKVKPMLESMNANAEHDQAEFIKEFKKNHPDPKGDPKGNPKGDPKGDPGDPNKEIKEQLAALTQKLQDREDREAAEEKRAGIRKWLKSKNVDDDEWISSMLEIAPIGKDDDVEEKGQSFLDLYNKSKAGGGPVPPGNPSSGGGDGADDQFKELKELLKAEEGAGQ